MRLKLWAAFAVSSLVASSFISVPEARADKGDRFDKSKDEKSSKGRGKDRDKDKDKEKEKETKGAKRIALSPEGLKFGLGIEGIARLYDKSIDGEFLPLYKKASPGPETDSLDAELKQRKGELRRSKVEFGETPTGVDQTALKGEYSYANGESMGRLTLRSGTERYFFFFGDRLWKVYDEHKLKKGSKVGENFDEALKELTARFGAPPKRVAAEPGKGRNYDEAQWVTADMVIRALDRGNILAVAYVDREVDAKLPQMRKNRPKDQHGMDPDVAAALKKNDAPDPKKKDEKEKDAKGKGKDK